MLRNYFLINILLLLIVCLLGLKFYRVFLYEKEIPSGASVEKPVHNRYSAFRKSRIPGKVYFNLITEKNIFRSSRSSSLLGVTSRERSTPKDLPLLFGIIIVAGEKRALLKDAPGQTAKMYQVNDNVSGYLVVDIRDDRVLLEGGGQTVEVKLRGKKGFKPLPESSNRKRRVARPSPKRTIRSKAKKSREED